MSKAFEKFYQLQKVEDVRQRDGSVVHVMYGVATAEKPDRDNEVAVFDDIAEEYRRWSVEAYDSTTAAGQEPSLGNLRIQHSLAVAGKVIGIDYDRQRKEIRVKSTPKDEQVWSEVLRGIWRGYSHAGSYKFRRCSVCNSDVKGKGNWCDHCHTSGNPIRYSAVLAELSIVDSPALREAAFEYVKSDGSHEMRKFAAPSGGSLVTWDKWDVDPFDDAVFMVPRITGDDSTGLEDFELRKVFSSCAMPAYPVGSPDTLAFDLPDDSLGF